MKIVKLDDVRKAEADMEGAFNVFKQLPISQGDGSPSFSIRVFTIEPEGHTPFHTHDFEHINYIIEGRGALVMESGEERELNKGDFALVMPAEKHQYRNKSGDKPMIMICAVPKEFE